MAIEPESITASRQKIKPRHDPVMLPCGDGREPHVRRPRSKERSASSIGTRMGAFVRHAPRDGDTNRIARPECQHRSHHFADGIPRQATTERPGPGRDWSRPEALLCRPAIRPIETPMPGSSLETECATGTIYWAWYANQALHKEFPAAVLCRGADLDPPGPAEKFSRTVDWPLKRADSRLYLAVFR